ncbi:MAG: LamG domain-containing protein [Candidatus Brocadiae bacterium]|nr:LamG domain-containing protein [Candidatus Brocadiia bacterium]
MKQTILFAFFIICVSPVLYAVSFPNALAAYDMESVNISNNLIDVSGNGNTSYNGLGGGGSLVSSNYGKALRFDASSRTPLAIADTPSLRLSQAFTIEARILIEGACVNNGGSRNIDWVRVVGKGNDAENRNYGIWYNENEGWLFQIDPIGTNINTFASVAQVPIARNQWYHLLGLYDGSNLKMYVNGIRVGTDTAISPSQFPLDSSPLTIGGSPSEHSKHVGLIDDVAIFGYALNESQIQYQATGVPEPASLFMMLSAFLLFLASKINFNRTSRDYNSKLCAFFSHGHDKN